MKKVIIAVAAGLLLTAGFTSCKKEHTCVCTFEMGGVSTSAEAKLGKTTKKDAKAACEKSSSQYGSGAGVTCKLK